jgi:hypothetical protein
MLKKPSAPVTTTNYNGGLMSLDEMNLDNRDNFEGDEIDPFGFGGGSNANSITLKKQKHVMTGVKMSITEEEMKAQKE